MMLLSKLNIYLIPLLFIPWFIFGMKDNWGGKGRTILDLDQDDKEYPYSYLKISFEEISNNKNKENAENAFKELERKLKQLVKEYHPDQQGEENKLFAREVFKKICAMRDTIKDDIGRGFILRKNEKQKFSSSKTHRKDIFKQTFDEVFWEQQKEEIKNKFEGAMQECTKNFYMSEAWKNCEKIKDKGTLNSAAVVRDFLLCSKNRDMVIYMNSDNKLNKGDQQKFDTIQKTLKIFDHNGQIWKQFESLKCAIELYIDIFANPKLEKREILNKIKERKKLDESLNNFFQCLKNIKNNSKRSLIDTLVLGYKDINNYSPEYKDILNINWSLSAYFLKSVEELEKERKEHLKELQKSKERYKKSTPNAPFDHEATLLGLRTPITEAEIVFEAKEYNLLNIIKEKDAQLKKDILSGWKRWAILSGWKRWAYGIGLGAAITGSAYLVNKYLRSPRQPVKN